MSNIKADMHRIASEIRTIANVFARQAQSEDMFFQSLRRRNQAEALETALQHVNKALSNHEETL